MSEEDNNLEKKSNNTEFEIIKILKKYLKVIAPKDNTCIGSEFGNHIKFDHYEMQINVKSILENKDNVVKSILMIFNSRQDEKALSKYEIEKKDSYIHSISNKNRLSVFLGLNGKTIDAKQVDERLKVFHGKLIKTIKNLDEIINNEILKLDEKTTKETPDPENEPDTVLHGLDIFFDKIYEKTDLLKIGGLENQIPRAIYEILYCCRLHNDLSLQIPLINGTALDVCEWIKSNDPEIVSKKSKIEKYKEIINKLVNNIPEITNNKNNKISKYFILDQFFNLIHKVKEGDPSEEKAEDKKAVNEQEINELYQSALKYKNQFNTKGYYENLLKEFKEHLKHHKNIIYYGSPGTGKTYISELCCKLLASGEKIDNNFKPNEFIKKEINNVELVQFHPSYTYEDFIEGIKPGIKNDKVVFEYKKGHFREFVDKVVEKNNDEKYFFIIDEINRANLSAVFGEILYALEKRGQPITTQYSHLIKNNNKKFVIPDNVYVIGTMNDIDRSIDAFDLALRRRFMWVGLDFDELVLKKLLFDDKFPVSNIEGYNENCKNLNKFLNQDLGLGKSFELGHAYYMRICDFLKTNSKKKELINDDELNRLKTQLFDHHLLPLISEYLRSKYEESYIKDKIEKCKKVFI